MVEKNIRLKTHLGNGVYDTLHPETNSKIVRVGDKNLDETLTEVTAQLAQTTQTLQGIDKTFGDQTFANLSALQSQYPNGDSKRYIVASDGKWYWWSGSSWLAGQVAQGVGIADESVNRTKLTNNFSLNGNISAGVDLKTLVNEGVYFGQPNAGYTNAPSDLAAGRYFELRVDVLSDSWSIQTITDFTNPGSSWRKTIHRTNISGVSNPWEHTTNLLNSSVARGKLADNYSNNGTLATGTDLNNVVKAGTYLSLAGSTYLNVPAELTGKSFVLNVYLGGAINSFVVQEITEHNNSKNFFRRMNTNAANPGLWSKFSDASNSVKKPLEGKTIVQFGDSIYGNKRPPNDISTTLSTKTGATVYNLGIGGSRMSQHQQYWDATSMYRLADAIATGDFTLQDELIAEYDAGRLNGLPYYVKEVIQLMKTIDWDTVYGFTIGHGTNDLTANVLLDNDANLFDTATYGGSLRYSLKTILEAYPHIQVFVISPMYRFWTEDAAPYNFIEDSDEAIFTGGKLTDFVDKAERVSTQEKTHYIDAYNHFGIGKSNRHYYFDDLLGNGGTHHNDSGAKYIGEKLSSEIVSRV